MVGDPVGDTIPEFKPGTLVTHERFGTGTVTARDSKYTRVDFGARGEIWLVTAVAAPMMKVTGFSPPPPRRVRLVPDQIPPEPEKRFGSEPYDPLLIRGRDEWDTENTTPNTPLYRTGRRR
jgi:hypothetical protein